MLARNPLKRRAEEELLPLHAPKRPRTSSHTESLTVRWITFGEEVMDLVHDTGIFIYYKLSSAVSFVLGYEHEEPTQPPPQPQRQPEPQVPEVCLSYPISPPPSAPSSPSKKVELKSISFSPSTVRATRIVLPSPPLSSTSSSEISSLEADLNKRRTVRFKSPPPPPRYPPTSEEDESTSGEPLLPTSNTISVPAVNPLPTPPPSITSGSSPSPPTTFAGLYPKIDQAIAAAVHRQAKATAPRKIKHIKHREHILQGQFKAGIKDQLRKTREDMERELYLLRRRTTGFRSSMKEFRGWLGYRERLELLQKLEDTKPSPSLEDLRDADLMPPLSRSKSNPVASTTYIQRALRDAEKSLFAPKPVVFAPSLARLQATQAKVSEEIDARIRPKCPSLPVSLLPEDDIKVEELLRRRGVIGKCVREQVSDKDLQRLRPGQWLNDEIINFYGQMITCRAEESKENSRENLLDVHYLSTFFWSKLKNEGYEKGRLAKWTKKLDLFSKDVVLIPVNHNNSHWTGAAINFRKKRIESYDSMNMDRAQVFKLLRAYLDAEHRNKKKKPFNFDGWVDWTLEDTPQQENGYDCGVFTCQFLETLSRGEEKFAFTQANMHYLRRRMIWEIGHTKLWTDR